MAKIRESIVRKVVRDILFEDYYHQATTQDKRAGQEKAAETTLGQEIPIEPMDQTATQLSTQRPPIEDENYTPENSKELAKAAEAILQDVSPEQVEFVYTNLKKVHQKAINMGNNPGIAKNSEDPDTGIERPVSAIKKKKVEESFRKHIRSLLEWGARDRDAARKWKQGDDLDLHRDDEEDLEAIRQSGMELPPEYELADIDKETQDKLRKKSLDAPKEWTLQDLVSSGVLPSVRGVSGMRQWIERTFAVFRLPDQAWDDMMKFQKSDFALEAFVESMIDAELLKPSEAEELLGPNRQAALESEFFKYFFMDAFVMPAVRAVKKNPEVNVQAKIQDRWNRMSTGQRAASARKSMKSNLEFKQFKGEM